MSALSIFALGSPFGIDRLGWSVLRSLREDAARRHGRALRLHCMAGCEQLLAQWSREPPSRAWIIDTLLDSRTQGIEVREVSSAQLQQCTSAVSAHVLDLHSTLQLAERLHVLPRDLRIIGLCVADENTDHPPQALVERLAQEVAAQLNEENPQLALCPWNRARSKARWCR